MKKTLARLLCLVMLFSCVPTTFADEGFIEDPIAFEVEDFEEYAEPEIFDIEDFSADIVEDQLPVDTPDMIEAVEDIPAIDEAMPEAEEDADVPSDIETVDAVNYENAAITDIGAVFSRGYVMVRANAIAYADESLSNQLGIFASPAYAYAIISDSGIARVWFDTDAARAADAPIPSAFIAADDCAIIESGAIADFEAAMASDPALRVYKDASIPLARFLPIDEGTVEEAGEELFSRGDELVLGENSVYTDAGETVWKSFTAPYAGTFGFYSDTNSFQMFESDGTTLIANRNSIGEGADYYTFIEYALAEGQTVVLSLRHKSYTEAGYVPVLIKPVNEPQVLQFGNNTFTPGIGNRGSFTAPYDGTFSFYTENASKPVTGSLRRADGITGFRFPDEISNSWIGNDFRIVCPLTAGQTVFFYVFYQSPSATGSVNIIVEPTIDISSDFVVGENSIYVKAGKRAMKYFTAPHSGRYVINSTGSLLQLYDPNGITLIENGRYLGSDTYHSFPFTLETDLIEGQTVAICLLQSLSESGNLNVCIDPPVEYSIPIVIGDKYSYTLKPGQKVTRKFTAPSTDTYIFYCAPISYNYGYLYEIDGTTLIDSTKGFGFTMSRDLTAGQSVIFVLENKEIDYKHISNITVISSDMPAPVFTLGSSNNEFAVFKTNISKASFTAPYSGTYQFDFTVPQKTIGYLYQSDGTTLITSANNYQTGQNISLKYNMLEGETIVLGVQTNSFPTAGIVNASIRCAYASDIVLSFKDDYTNNYSGYAKTVKASPVVAVGDYAYFKLSYNNHPEMTFTAKSSNTGIVAVSGSKLSFKKAGSADITFTASNGASFKLRFKVVAAPKKLKISSVKVKKGKTKSFSIKDQNGKWPYTYIHMTRSVGGVAKIIGKQKLQAKKAGKGKITVKLFNGVKGTAKITVKK